MIRNNRNVNSIFRIFLILWSELSSGECLSAHRLSLENWAMIRPCVELQSGSRLLSYQQPASIDEINPDPVASR